MLSEALKEAFGSFKRVPGTYIYFTILSTLFCTLSLLAGLGIILLLFFLFSIANYQFFSLAGFIASTMVSIFTFWFMSGVHGATIRYYGNVLSGKNYSVQVGFIEFLSYAVNNASQFFLVGLVRLILVTIPILILYLIYSFLGQYNIPFMDIIFGVVTMLVVFVIFFLFFPVFISLAIYEAGIRPAFGNAVKLTARAHVKAVLLYFCHCVVWVLNFVPLINLLTFFVAYPISYISLIALFKRAAR